MATASDTQPLDRAGSAQAVLLSAEGERAMREELERLRHELEVDVVARLKEAREYGAGSENDDLHQIREEEAILTARIARLEEILARARVVSDDVEDDVVTLGSRVRVRDAASGKVTTLVLVGGHEPAEAGSVSAASPVGQALLGASPGETVSVPLPKGKTKTLEVLGVEA
jgi:transcription elongation GreA/GreB family factor